MKSVKIILFSITAFLSFLVISCNHPTEMSDFVSYHEINYVLNGGINNPLNKTECIESDGTIPLYDAYRPGYVFLGWYLNWAGSGSRILTIDCSSLSEDLFLYAIFGNTITYEFNGGTQSGWLPTSVSSSSGIYTLNEPTRSGYVFSGWFSDPDFKTRVRTVSYNTMKGNLTLYAKWVEYSQLTIISVDVNIGKYVDVTLNFKSNESKNIYNSYYVWTEGGLRLDSFSGKGYGQYSVTVWNGIDDYYYGNSESCYFQRGKTYTIWITDSRTSGSENIKSNKYTFTIPNASGKFTDL